MPPPRPGSWTITGFNLGSRRPENHLPIRSRNFPSSLWPCKPQLCHTCWEVSPEGSLGSISVLPEENIELMAQATLRPPSPDLSCALKASPPLPVCPPSSQSYCNGFLGLTLCWGADTGPLNSVTSSLLASSLSGHRTWPVCLEVREHPGQDKGESSDRLYPLSPE